MKEPGVYTLSNGQTVRIVSAERVSETIKVTVTEAGTGDQARGGLE